jgi:hypothetical protein
LALSVAASIPAIALLLRFVGAGGGGGTWLPGPPDLLALFAQVTCGLAAARGYFLDSVHLTLPGLAGVPDLAWTAFGLLPGAFAILELASAWHKQDPSRIKDARSRSQRLRWRSAQWQGRTCSLC